MPRPVAAVFTLILPLAPWLTPAVHAEVTLPALLSDHAVLQRGPATRIWGQADPGEAINVTLDTVTAQTTADSAGKWETKLNLEKIGPGPRPFELIVTGKNTLSVKDVVIGEVWLCAGQSNMQYTLKGDSRAAPELKSTYPLLRQFKVETASAAAPAAEVPGTWVTMSPETAAAFTAVGYYFGKKLSADLGAPVGLINASVPGSAIESWLSAEAFATQPALNNGRLARLKKLEDYPAKLAEYVAAYNAWAEKYARADTPADPAAYAAPGITTTDWASSKLPGALKSATLPASGAIWLRRNFPANAMAAGKPGTIVISGVHDFVAIYLNGTKIAETTPALPPPAGIYKFAIPAEVIREGDNILALRIFSATDAAGIDSRLAISPYGVGAPLFLDEGPAKAESTLPPLTEDARKSIPKAPSVPSPAFPSNNYNAMIAPLHPYAIRGVVWYQGEANVPRAAEYQTTFPAMIQDFRAKWSVPDLPFYFVQLPNYAPRGTEPGKDQWAEQRHAQAQALKLPHTGAAITIDVGEEANLHPANKKDPGERLARLALAETYRKSILAHGPEFASMVIEGSQVRIKFNHAEGGLVARELPATYKPISVQPPVKPLVRTSPGSQLEGFAVCGEDQKWTWAEARIEGADTVIVTAAAVAKPIAVRYAWSDSTFVNLYNATADLPAMPFRTDEFPLTSEKFRY